MSAEELVYQQMSPMMNQKDSGAEQRIYAVDRQIKKADEALRVKLSQSIVDGANKIAISDFNNSMTEQLHQAYSENAANPDGFLEASSEIQNNLLKQVPFHMREEAKSVFNQQATRYHLKASDGLNRVQRDQLTESTLRGNQSAAVRASEAINDFLGGNPGSLETLGEAYTDFKQNLNAVDGSGIPLFDARTRMAQTDAFNGGMFNSFAVNKLASLKTMEEKQDFIERIELGEESFSVPSALGDPISVSGKDLYNTADECDKEEP